MKWYIAAVIGLLVLVALGFGVWREFRVDVRQPEFAGPFKKNFVVSCAREAEQSIIAAGHTVDDALKARIGEVCACGADATVAEFVKEGVSMAELLAPPSDPAFKARIGVIMKTCQQPGGTP
jgi:hypothetical protein